MSWKRSHLAILLFINISKKKKKKHEREAIGEGTPVPKSFFLKRMIPLVCRYEPGVLQSCSKAGEFLLDLVVVCVGGGGWVELEFPSFELFCTEAFQFDYEAPFHRALMQRAAQNESEPWADWLSGGLVVAALWGRHGDTPPPTPPAPLAELEKSREMGKATVSGSLAKWARATPTCSKSFETGM